MTAGGANSAAGSFQPNNATLVGFDYLARLILAPSPGAPILPRAASARGFFGVSRFRWLRQGTHSPYAEPSRANSDQPVSYPQASK